LKDGRGGEIRTQFDAFRQTIENKGCSMESMPSTVFRVFVKMKENATKSLSCDRKR
jgi:hypothetical protein